MKSDRIVNNSKTAILAVIVGAAVFAIGVTSDGAFAQGRGGKNEKGAGGRVPKSPAELREHLEKARSETKDVEKLKRQAEQMMEGETGSAIPKAEREKLHEELVEDAVRVRTGERPSVNGRAMTTSELSQELAKNPEDTNLQTATKKAMKLGLIGRAFDESPLSAEQSAAFLPEAIASFLKIEGRKANSKETAEILEVISSVENVVFEKLAEGTNMNSMRIRKIYRDILEAKYGKEKAKEIMEKCFA